MPCSGVDPGRLPAQSGLLLLLLALVAVVGNRWRIAGGSTAPYVSTDVSPRATWRPRSMLEAGVATRPRDGRGTGGWNWRRRRRRPTARRRRWHASRAVH